MGWIWIYWIINSWILMKSHWEVKWEQLFSVQKCCIFQGYWDTHHFYPVNIILDVSLCSCKTAEASTESFFIPPWSYFEPQKQKAIASGSWMERGPLFQLPVYTVTHRNNEAINHLWATWICVCVCACVFRQVMGNRNKWLHPGQAAQGSLALC